MPDAVTQALDLAVDQLLARTGQHLVLAAPLGLGKPHRLLNAITRRIAADPGRSLKLLTALSLTPPSAGQGLQKRFLAPFLSRQFGDDFPVLEYATAMRRDALPANVVVEEFYMQSGALLASKQAQRHYNSLNYTHVARAVAERGVNAVVQKVAREPGGTRLSLRLLSARCRRGGSCLRCGAGATSCIARLFLNGLTSGQCDQANRSQHSSECA